MSTLPFHPIPGGIRWYHGWTPYPYPCSWCGEEIGENEVPLTLWRGQGKDTEMARLHARCCDVALGLKVETVEPDEDRDWGGDWG